MGMLYPSLDEIMITKPMPTEGELFLIQKLKMLLDDSYEIFFQPFLNGDKPDIIIIKKMGGILIIEVKDWVLANYIIDNNGKFTLRKNNVHIKSPIDQVDRYKTSILELHLPLIMEKSILKNNVTQVIQTAVYFHNETTSSLSMLRYSIRKNMNILGRDSITKDGINALMNNTRLNGNSIYFDDDLYNETKRILQPSFQLYKDRININLDKKQKQLATSKSGSVKVKGIAGSGKSLVLAERAANCYKRTRGRILILTFNITLRNYLEERVGLALQKEGINRCVRKDFVIINYHQFINSQANNKGITITLESYENIGLFNGVDLINDRFDGIFIDEVQDFKYEWLKIVKDNFLNKLGEFVLFGDEKQNIYERDLDDQKLCKTNVLGRWSELNKCYRLEEKTAILAKQFQNKFLNKKYSVSDFEIEFEENLLSNSKVKYENVNRPFNYCNIVDSILKFIKENNINNNDVAIIAPAVEIVRQIEDILKKKYSICSTIMHETEDEYKKIVGKDDEVKHKKQLEAFRRAKKCNFRMNDGKLKLSTIQSFKGWEIHTLFLLYNEECSPEKIYSSITRAINSVYIFNLETEDYHEFFSSMVKQLGSDKL
ncbi:NERD domain-containing protein [Clostridium sp.]|uniref:NERD domain-containing protein n=1 Tax=Clostridium sp. TaxID=1506 RepID=UPI0029094DE6|nr:NERD domain-containing protein [Clostridium sp.]MDU7240419.1 NERD domain-containing protein [Clostridium sp.]